MSTSLVPQPSSSTRTMIAFPPVRNIFEDMESLTRQIAQRAFTLFQQRGGFDGQDLDDWLRAETDILKPVPIEMSESKDAYTIRAEVPGFDVKDINVQVEPNAIYLHGKSEQKKEEKKGKEVRYSEVSANEFCRQIDLPTAVIPEKVSAHLANGVLELNLPKSTPAKTVEIKAA
ncbi:MAG: Hsp20 family protein [Acidobacteriaceae bacterium]